MKKSILITIILCFGWLVQLEAQQIQKEINSQQKNLTKKQMYLDFDELIEILRDCNAQFPIRKAVTGIDLLEEAKMLRTEVDTITNINDFYGLLSRVLNYTFDYHAREVNSYNATYDNLKGIDTAIISKIVYKGFRFVPDIFPSNPLFVNNQYFINGEHKLIDVNNLNDTIIISDSKIIEYDGKPYKENVKKYLPYFYAAGIRWNYDNKEYYATSSLIPFSGILKLENNGQIINLDLNKKYNVIINMANQNEKKDIPKIHFNTEKKVNYFDKDSILYVYLDNMVDPEYSVAEKVKVIGKDKPIKKVIVDVRGNKGGGDLVWHKLLTAIVADSLKYDPILAFKNSKRIKKLYSNHPTFNISKKWIKVKTFDWLPNESFLVTSPSSYYLMPDSNSLNYKGKIYILQDQDVYSSGHSFSSYATHLDQLVSVGEPTGLLAGFGLSPALFQLKNSKFTFRMETAIDVSNAEKPVDVYQDFPEIIINIPPEKKHEYLKDFYYDRNCQKYLYEYDYLFQKVLDM